MFSSEGLTEEVFIFTLIQVAARTHFLWPEDSGPGFLLTMGWRLPSGCGGHLQFLEATHSALSRGLSNLVMHFIKPLCSAWWWNLIQFNTVTGVILTETIHYLSHILWIETNHKSHFYTNGWDYTKMCVYRVCLHLFYIWWQLLSLTPSSFLSASYLGKPIRKPAYSLDTGRKFKSYKPLAMRRNPHSLLHPLNSVKTSSHFRPSWEPPWPPLKASLCA